MKSWLALLFMLLLLLSACSAIAGNLSHWPASAVAVFIIVFCKLANDRFQILAWPMEFLLASGVIMIVINLARLYLIPLPY